MRRGLQKTITDSSQKKKKSSCEKQTPTHYLGIVIDMSAKTVQICTILLSEGGVSDMKEQLNLFDVDTISNLKYILKIKCAVHAWVH